jgi:diaminohydroxyphosphoribosylaminopyrimidine deaminase / 5-amino-6-(5-phosphoribosylamino)uracil reductase
MESRDLQLLCATRLAAHPSPPDRKLGSFNPIRMTTSTQDTHWMHRALSLARRGIGLASPNPAVGCVIVDDTGDLIGEGWHEYEFLDHAEIAALKNAAGITSDAECPIHSDASAEWVGSHTADRLKSAGSPIHSAGSGSPATGPGRGGDWAEWVGSKSANRLKGATAYVTLEPCNHTGRTGPCTQALIAAGVSRVVAATADPNPNVAGQGMQTLAAAGIQTTLGVCELEARRLNEAFAKWIQHKRPFVLMKLAMTLDGRIAPSPDRRPAREPYWITSEESRAAVQQLRHQADAVLTGIETILADDPLLTDRSGLRRRRPLLRVMLDSSLRTPLDSKIIRSAQKDLLIFTISSDQSRADELRKRGVRVEVLPAESARVPLTSVLDTLGSEGILTLLTEAGSRLNTALFAENLVDRLQFFVSPQIMGGAAVPAFRDIPLPITIPKVEISDRGNDLALTSLLRDPWQTPD